MTVAECAAYLSARDDFLIFTHTRPDGDTVGSAAALTRALRALGKTAYVFDNTEVTARYRPLISDLIAPQGFAHGCAVTVDTASTQMFPDGAERFAARIDLAIDHHVSYGGYAGAAIVRPECAACGDLMLEIIDALGVPLDADIAAALYIAVATDTGCFSYDNTNAGAFYTASRCAEAGAPIAEINRELFRSKSAGRVAIEGAVYSGMEFFFGGRAAFVTITAAAQAAAGATEDDMENIAAVPVSIDGVDVGVTFREMPGGETKVSVRSSPAVSSNALAAAFGGGGHAAAAGFMSRKGLDVLRARMLELLAEVLR